MDSSIRVDTSLNNDGIKKGTKEMGEELKRLANATVNTEKVLNRVYGSKTQAQIDRLTQKYARQTEAIAKQEAEIQKLEDKRSQSNAKYEADIKKQEKLIDQLNAKLSNMGENPKGFSAMERQAKSAEREVQRLNKELVDIQKQAYNQEKNRERLSSPKAIMESENISAKLDIDAERVANEMERLKDRAISLRQKMAEIKLNPAGTEEGQKLKAQLDTATAKLNQLRQASVNAGASLDRDLGLGADKLERLGNEADATASQLKKLTDSPQKTVSIFSQLGNVAQKTGSVISSVFNKGASIIGKFAGAVKKVSGGLHNTTRNTDRASGAIGRLGKRITHLALAAFVFNGIRRALRELTDYLGSAMRTNQQFVKSLALIKGNLLTAFQPIFEAIMPALNALMSALARATAYIVAFVNFLFGKSVKASQDSAGALYDQTKALQGVGSAAKKAAGQLAAFDEINVLSKQDDSGGGSGTETILPEFSYDMSDIESWLDQFESLPERFYALGKKIAEAIAESLSNIEWAQIKERARTIAASIAEFINGFVDTPEFWYQIGGTIAEGLNTAAEFAEEYADRLKWHELGSMMALGVNSAIESWDPQVAARAVYKNLNGIMDTIYTFFTETNWGELGHKFAEGLNSIFEGLDADLLGRTFASKWNALVDIVYEFVTTFEWENLGLRLAESINAWFDEIDWAKAGETISEGVLGVLETIQTVIDEIEWQAIGESIKTYLINIDWVGIASALSSAIGTAFVGLGKMVVAFISDDLEEAGGSAMLSFLKGFVKASVNIPNFIAIGIVAPLISGILDGLGVGSGFQKAVENISLMMLRGFFALFNPAVAVANIIDIGKAIIEALEGIFEGFSSSAAAEWFFDNIVYPLIDATTWLIEQLSAFFTMLWDNIKSIFTGMAEWFDVNVVQPVIKIFKPIIQKIGEIFSKLWEVITVLFGVLASWFNDNVIMPIVSFFTDMWETLTEQASNAWTFIKDVWSVVADWFNDSIVTPIAKFFGSLWEGIKSGASVLADFIKQYVIIPIINLFGKMYNSVVSIVEGVINGFIGIINGFIRGLNSVIDAINRIPGVNISSVTTLPPATIDRMPIPALASGAVIPPNSEFLALLGDQKHGRNIEAPEGLIKQIVRDELSNLELPTPSVTLNADPDMAALIRLIFPMLKTEERLRGPSLIAGGAT